MMGYRFMVRLRCYYTVHRPLVGGMGEGQGQEGRRGEGAEMQAASRRIWFSGLRTGVFSEAGVEKEDAAIRGPKG